MMPTLLRAIEVPKRLRSIVSCAMMHASPMWLQLIAMDRDLNYSIVQLLFNTSAGVCAARSLVSRLVSGDER